MVSLPEEQWRAIEGYEGEYEVSNLGRVRGLTRVIHSRNQLGPFEFVKPGHMFTPSPDSRGYLSVSFCGKTARVHVLVAAAFIGPKPIGKREINHKNGDKLDNRVENLEYATRSENMKHAYQHNLVAPLPKGERHNRARATNEIVRTIRTAGSNERTADIARRVGLRWDVVARIRAGQTWKHVQVAN